SSAVSYDAADSFAKNIRRREQRDDEPAVALEIEKVSGMNDDSAIEKLERELFIAARLRHADHGGPAAFDGQQLPFRFRGDRELQRVEILARALRDCGADSRRDVQQFGQRDLHGSCDGEEVVSDELEGGDGFTSLTGRSADADPAELVV